VHRCRRLRRLLASRSRCCPAGRAFELEYEVLSAEGGRVHDEHAVLARSPADVVLITAHSHAGVVTVLDETERGASRPARAARHSRWPSAWKCRARSPGVLVVVRGPGAGDRRPRRGHADSAIALADDTVDGWPGLTRTVSGYLLPVMGRMTRGSGMSEPRKRPTRRRPEPVTNQEVRP
jgi:hypothetical protein